MRVGAATTGVLAFVTKSWSSAAAAGLTAAMSTVVGVWTSRGANAVAERHEQHRGMPGLILLDRRGRPPRIRELDDPVPTRSHPAAQRGGRHGRTPVFVVRDITQKLSDAIRSDYFVLLVGESTAGKTRAANEAIRALERRVSSPWNDSDLRERSCARSRVSGGGQRYTRPRRRRRAGSGAR